MTSIPDEIRTRRLVPRRVGPGDQGAAIAVMGGPETNLHNPAGPASPDLVAAQPEEWQAHWARDGIGCTHELDGEGRPVVIGTVLRGRGDPVSIYQCQELTMVT